MLWLHAHRNVLHPRRFALALALSITSSAAGCSDDGPAAFQAADPIEVDVRAEALASNGGRLYEFVADSDGYVSVPSRLPAGEVVVTLTYIGDAPAPHSLVFEGLNGDQPVVAVDLPGSNNGTVHIAEGEQVFFDGAPGNRAKGYVGTVAVTGDESTAGPSVQSRADLWWSTAGVQFVGPPDRTAPANVPVALHLDVIDQLPHSIAFERVRDEQPLVAVDGPGVNQRTIVLSPGTYVYFCAVPGHRAAGMEGRLVVG
jgi:hypothetical protein